MMSDDLDLGLSLGPDTWDNIDDPKRSTGDKMVLSDLNFGLSFGPDTWKDTDDPKQNTGNKLMTSELDLGLSFGPDTWKDTDDPKQNKENITMSSYQNSGVSFGPDTWNNLNDPNQQSIRLRNATISSELDINLCLGTETNEERGIHPSTKPNVREQSERTTSSSSSPSKEPPIDLPMGRSSGTERSIWNTQDMLQNLLHDQDKTCSNASGYGRDHDDDYDDITDDNDSNASGYGIDDDCNYVTTISARKYHH